MPGRLESKVSIVTGGGAGLGEAICKLFAEQGARVVVADINKADAQRVAGQITSAGGQAIACHADVSCEDDVRTMVDTALSFDRRIDILVNNAAIGGAGYNYTVVDAPMDRWQRCVEVNLRGPFLCMKHVIPRMIASPPGSAPGSAPGGAGNGGAVVNIGSISSVVGLMTQSMYAPTKAAILQLTRQAAVDYARMNIRINCLLPGGMKTPMTQREMDEPGSEALLEKELELLPMGRLAEPREVAFAAVFLASDEASFITGAALAVDGGYTAQ